MIAGGQAPRSGESWSATGRQQATRNQRRRGAEPGDIIPEHWATSSEYALSRAVRPIGFLGGIWMLWHNPKGWAMTLGAAASSGSLVSGPLGLCVLLGTVFGIFALFSLSAWCAAGLLLARAMRSDAQSRALNIVLGGLLALSIVPIWFRLWGRFFDDHSQSARCAGRRDRALVAEGDRTRERLVCEGREASRRTDVAQAR